MEAMNNDSLLHRTLTEILNSTRDTARIREAIAEQLHSTLMAIALSHHPMDPHQLSDAVSDATEQFSEKAELHQVPNPVGALLLFVRRRVIDIGRSEVRRSQRLDTSIDDDGNHRVLREADHWSPVPEFHDLHDRILAMIDQLCLGRKPGSAKHNAYRAMQQLLLDGHSLEVPELARKAIPLGLSQQAIQSALKRFRAAVRQQLDRDPEFAELAEIWARRRPNAPVSHRTVTINHRTSRRLLRSSRQRWRSSKPLPTHTGASTQS